MSLTPEDLAYMRSTAAESRPTQATLHRRVQTRTASGGIQQGWDGGTPIQVRIDGTPDEVPDVVGERVEGGTAVKITMDMAADVRDGDRLNVDGSEGYEIVSDGNPDRWATAQVVWARRYLHPART